MGRLDVRIVEARNLPNTEMIGKPDPYVIVECENHNHKTSVASNSCNPKWDEVFKFLVSDPDSVQLVFKLWNKNLVSDDFMGQYKMSLGGLTKGVVKDTWVLLQQCKTNAELHIRLMAHDFGREPNSVQAAQIRQQVQHAPPPPPASSPASPPQPMYHRPTYQQAPPPQSYPAPQYPPPPQPSYGNPRPAYAGGYPAPAPQGGYGGYPQPSPYASQYPRSSPQQPPSYGGGYPTAAYPGQPGYRY